MRIFKTKAFSRFQRRERIADSGLLEAIERIELGLVDADLGHALIKQRVARPGEGRRSGFRTIVAYEAAARAVFIYGFAKNQRSNVNEAQLSNLADFAVVLLGLGDDEVRLMMDEGELKEVL